MKSRDPRRALLKARSRPAERARPAHAVAAAAPVPLSNLRQIRVAAYETVALAKRGDRLAQNRLVGAAVGISLAVHAILLGVRFVVEETKQAMHSPPLEVVLV